MSIMVWSSSTLRRWTEPVALVKGCNGGGVVSRGGDRENDLDAGRVDVGAGASKNDNGSDGSGVCNGC